jgi:hypothetical protein
LDLRNGNLILEGDGYIQMMAGSSVIFDPGRTITIQGGSSFILKSAGGTEIRKQ